MSKITHIDNQFESFVMRCNILDDFDSVVGGAIVNANVFIIIGLPCHHGSHALMQLFNVSFFVVARGDDADQLCHIDLRLKTQ